MNFISASMYGFGPTFHAKTKFENMERWSVWEGQVTFSNGQQS